MSKIKVNGIAVTITSELSMEDIKFLSKYEPDALAIFEGDEDAQEEIFRVFYGIESQVADLGVVFARDNAKGKAEITVLVPEQVKDVKKYVTENFFGAIRNLNAVEEYAVARANAIRKEFADFEASIEGDDDVVKTVTKKVTKKSN